MTTRSTHPLLDFSVEGFRCFRERADFTETRHVNVIAGPNNSGKSSVMAVLRRLTTTNFPPAQVYRGETYFGGDTIEMMRFTASDVTHGADCFTVTFNRALALSETTPKPPPAIFLRGQRDMRMPSLGGALYLRRGVAGDEASQGAKRAPVEAEIVKVFDAAIAKIVYVPAVRRVGGFLHHQDLPDATESLFDGSSVLPTLLAYANPSREFGTVGGDEKLAEVERTMAGLVGKSVRLRPLPAERDVEVEIDGRAVGLQRLGAGLEQVLVLASAFTEHPDALLLIEEPENFLHPTLQRRVLERLLERTGDSVITTHSNHLLDVRDERVGYYRTYVTETGSRIERTNGVGKYEVLWDLGVRPSSLFESNATIWVEGPSDAILLRAWLQHVPEAEGLIEGVHYSFAFHAGSLLDKFFIDWNDEQQPDEEHVVNFCALHPNFFIVADSDGTATKEFGHEYLSRIAPKARERGLLWATAGKEIENYLPRSVFETYLMTRANPRRNVVGEPTAEEFRWLPIWKIFNVLSPEDPRGDYPQKVTFAEWAAEELAKIEQSEALGVLDLKDRLIELVRFIRKASGNSREET